MKILRFTQEQVTKILEEIPSSLGHAVRSVRNLAKSKKMGCWQVEDRLFRALPKN